MNRLLGERRYLARQDPTMGALMRRVGPCRLQAATRRDPFEALTRAIAAQQVSVKAAETIFTRFCGLFPGGRPTPDALVLMPDDHLRACGFSRTKVGFIRDLATRVGDGRLDLAGLRRHDDDEVIRQLVTVKGIGRWTAEVFLIFHLGRLDVLPADDLGLLTALGRAYGLRARPTPERLRRAGESWRPYRSVAAWYLWASLK